MESNRNMKSNDSPKPSTEKPSALKKPPKGPELRRLSNRLAKRGLANLNYNATHDNPEVKSEMDQLLDSPNVLKPETVKTLLAQGHLRMWKIADRWSAGWPEKIKAMEANGTLMLRLDKQATKENRTISNARVAGKNSDLPDSEILALYGIPAAP